MTPYLLAPLPTMLGIRAGAKISVINPPSGFAQKLNPLPEGVEFLITARTGLDLILFFTDEKLELVERLPALSRAMAVNGRIWICWPKREGRAALTEDFVRLAALDIGLVDDKRCTIDETWSGLRLLWRPRAPRPEKPASKKKSASAQA